jgi:hypothetical protein
MDASGFAPSTEFSMPVNLVLRIHDLGLSSAYVAPMSANAVCVAHEGSDEV